MTRPTDLLPAITALTTTLALPRAATAAAITIKDDSSPAVTPDLAHMQDGSYPLSRPLFFYLRDKPTGDVKAFIDWVLSKEGQDVVTKVGYFPVK